MKVCVYGAGAVGSVVASRLMQAGQAEVSVVARGEHLRAIASQGLRLVTAQGESVDRPALATDRPRELPPQDIVFVTLKAMSQPACAADIAALIKPGGHAVFANNGIPWWWKHGRAGEAPLPLVDTGEALWNTVAPQRALACVIYSSSEITAPGVVLHRGNNRWLLGEPAGMTSARLDGTVALMRACGFAAEACADIRRAVWGKLLRNVPVNPICALTRLPIDGVAADAELAGMVLGLMDEVVRIAAAQGSDISGELEANRAWFANGGGREGAPLAGVRPSMLQDALAGRRIEVEAILGQVQLLARESGTPCPVLDGLVPLVRALDRGLARG